MNLRAKSLLQVVLCLVIVQSGVAHSAGPGAHPLAALTAQSRAAALAEDFATLAGARFGQDLSLTTSVNADLVTVNDEQGKPVFQLSFGFDRSGQFPGIPTVVESSLGPSANLAQDWKNIFVKYEAKREAYHALKPEGTAAEFEAWFTTTEKIGELMLPIDQAIAKVISDSFAQLAQRQFHVTDTPRARSHRNYSREATADRWRDRLMYSSLLTGFGLVIYGFYQEIMGPGGMSDHSYYGSQVSNYGGVELGVGAAMLAAYLVNAFPVFFDNDMFSDRLVHYLRDRRINRDEAKIRDEEIKKITELKAEIDRNSQSGYRFGSTTLRLSLGSLTDVAADAWIVPEFAEEAVSGGVVAAVERAGGQPGIDAYQNVINRDGPPAHGSIVVTESGPGARAAHLIHVATVGSSGFQTTRTFPAAVIRKEYAVIRTALISAMNEARKRGFKKIVIPELGTGIAGSLDGSGLASLQVLLESIAAIENQNPGAQPLEVVFALWRHPNAFAAYDTLVKKAKVEGIKANAAFQPTARDEVLWSCEAKLHAQK